MRITVVGAGAIGLASVYRLAKDGCEVTVLDARQAGSTARRAAAHPPRQGLQRRLRPRAGAPPSSAPAPSRCAAGASPAARPPRGRACAP
ncbi:FAD-dependent oxidoreductase [Streptomyces sparsogenes]|uniref:FAD-dependent oxidoreductase n=1 Tax=Streptomyces sparsogenes TaxID=67365 RepID=UPI0033168C49